MFCCSVFLNKDVQCLYVSAANGDVNRVGVACSEDDDVTDSLTNDVSSLEVTCHGACVEMLPAGSAVDSDDENDNNDRPSS